MGTHVFRVIGSCRLQVYLCLPRTRKRRVLHVFALGFKWISQRHAFQGLGRSGICNIYIYVYVYTYVYIYIIYIYTYLYILPPAYVHTHTDTHTSKRASSCPLAIERAQKNIHLGPRLQVGVSSQGAANSEVVGEDLSAPWCLDLQAGKFPMLPPKAEKSCVFLRGESKLQLKIGL